MLSEAAVSAPPPLSLHFLCTLHLGVRCSTVSQLDIKAQLLHFWSSGMAILFCLLTAMLKGHRGGWYLFFLAAVIPGKSNSIQVEFNHPQTGDLKLTWQDCFFIYMSKPKFFHFQLFYSHSFWYYCFHFCLNGNISLQECSVVNVIYETALVSSPTQWSLAVPKMSRLSLCGFSKKEWYDLSRSTSHAACTIIWVIKFCTFWNAVFVDSFKITWLLIFFTVDHTH